MKRSLFGGWLMWFSRWRRRREVRNAATLGLVVLGPILVGLTFLALGPLDQRFDASGLRLILLADFVYALVVAALVGQRIAQMISARRAKSAGSRLHLRLTSIFALLALIPTVLVAIFAMITVNFGLEGWFSDRVRQVLGTSFDTAQAYKEEHRLEVTRDGQDLARYLDRLRSRTFFMNPGEIRQALGGVPDRVRQELHEIYVIDSAGEIVARGPASYEFGYERPSPEDIATALETGLLIIEDWENSEFRALIPLTAFVDYFVYVSREVDGEVLALLDETQETVGLYQQLEQDRGRLLLLFGLLFLGFAVILILAAIWLGLWFADRLARPVGRLTGAAQRVGQGDLSVRVREEEGDDEISMLSRYFNQMTSQLKEQRQALLENNKQVERRRRLFDSVLSSVTSGVVGLDPQGRVTFINRAARALLDLEEGAEATALTAAIPEFAQVYERAMARGGTETQDQISLVRSGQVETLLVRIAPRWGEDSSLEGYVVAFDDVTDLVSAQRMAAWGDVARRIAHEIKNPLTPIQLSAERIRRKFGAEVEDAEKLEQMTDVIVRQTGDLRRIVDEFSKFARMPEPSRESHDLITLVRDAVTLQEAGQPGVSIVADLPDTTVLADVDGTMISQALTNLIKNAGEAIDGLKESGNAPEGYAPEIRISFAVGDSAEIRISDNGVGLPQDRTRLFEPYVTTRDKGTGLGLPIVKKIIEEHGGTLALVDADPFAEGAHRGAQAILNLPIIGTSQSMNSEHEEKEQWAIS